MSKVHILPPDIISKIAAGEVIDRPASVIKELVENSIDANTDTIEIHLVEAGKTSIKIKDTGDGIAEDDLDTIFHRHATSKIKTAEDLFDIHSLGFRGEALYSIAAIADIIVRSKTADADSGWEIHMRGGETLSKKPVSMPNGTEIEVKELFYNTPARRKFLKTNVSEMNQILKTVTPYILLYPNIRFLVSQDSKNSIDLSPEENLKTRVAQTLNLDEQYIIEAQNTLKDKDISVRFLLGDINILRFRRDMQFIFVNGRPVENKNISFHLNNVYRLIFPPRSYPFFVAYIDIPNKDIDANIHPTKREVKIRDEQSLCSSLRHICETTLMTASQAKQVQETTKPQESSILYDDAPHDTFKDIQDTNDNDSWDSQTTRPTEEYTFPEQQDFSQFSQALLAEKQDSLQAKLTNANYIGSFINKYLFFEIQDSLLIIDQHAAQERITFEHLIHQMEQGAIEVQHLLSPYIIKLTPAELLIWENAQETLEKIGFSSSQFDNETIAVHSYPNLIKDSEKAVRDILAGEDIARCDHVSLARRACRASIMAGDRLTKEQVEFQRQQLLECKDPFTCPHGRPTVMEMKEDFLNKQFLRS